LDTDNLYFAEIPKAVRSGVSWLNYISKNRPHANLWWNHIEISSFDMRYQGSGVLYNVFGKYSEIIRVMEHAEKSVELCFIAPVHLSDSELQIYYSELTAYWLWIVTSLRIGNL